VKTVEFCWMIGKCLPIILEKHNILETIKEPNLNTTQEVCLSRTLIVGYGNADRQDDGAAWHILSGIAQRLGRPVPNLPEDGFFPEGEAVDLWFVLQLAPEMGEDFADYDRICFVDAHTGNIPGEILLRPVEGSQAASAFTHHMTPATCLALTQTIYHREPEAVLLSVRGYDFGFERMLSPRTAALVEQAVEMLWEWLG
jgi:hydrogenase maturation protease